MYIFRYILTYIHTYVRTYIHTYRYTGMYARARNTRKDHFAALCTRLDLLCLLSRVSPDFSHILSAEVSVLCILAAASLHQPKPAVSLSLDPAFLIYEPGTF